MGIQGLLPFLRSYVKKTHIEAFQGTTIGVDAMCWMHKGAYACSRELVEGRDTDKFVNFFLRMCTVLLHHKIKPIIVFDGERLPAKAKEEKRRGEVREAARLQALELLQRKHHGEDVDEREVNNKCETAIKVTSSMISRLQSALRELSIDFLVAPYEADAQLAYMCRIGWISTAISEDSDLLAYGCPSTLFKMDKHGNGDHISLPFLQIDHAGQEVAIELPEADTKKGKGKKAGKSKKSGKSPEEVDQDEFGAETEAKTKAKSAQLETADKEVQIHLNSWSPEKFSEFCVFCGTDYKDPDTHIKKFGIKTAFNMMCKHSDAEALLSWMLTQKQFKERFPCDPSEYIPRFRQVVAVFWHHVVFDPKRGECISIASSFPLTKTKRVLDGLDLQEVCGNFFDRQEALLMARGEMDPRSRQLKRLEPLTIAERRFINRLLEDKRSELTEYRFQVSLQEEAQRRAEAEVNEPPKEVEEQIPQADNGEDGQEADVADVQVSDKSIHLLPGDERKLLEIKNQFSKTESDDPTMEPHEKSKSTNPFSRKRVATPCHNGRAVPTAPVLVSKRAKVTLTTPHVEAAPQRQFKSLAPHSRGGYGAKEAAQAVLAQRGIADFEALEEDRDKSKLKYFFPCKTEEKKPANKPSKLSAWNPRSWEDDTPEIKSVGHNSLSIRGGAWPGWKLRSGWG